MQVRNEVKELRLLFEVLQILDSASDLSDNLETVLEVMAEHTGMMRGVITLLDERADVHPGPEQVLYVKWGL